MYFFYNTAHLLALDPLQSANTSSDISPQNEPGSGLVLQLTQGTHDRDRISSAGSLPDRANTVEKSARYVPLGKYTAYTHWTAG